MGNPRPQEYHEPVITVLSLEGLLFSAKCSCTSDDHNPYQTGPSPGGPFSGLLPDGIGIQE